MSIVFENDEILLSFFSVADVEATIVLRSCHWRAVRILNDPNTLQKLYQRYGYGDLHHQSFWMYVAIVNSRKLTPYSSLYHSQNYIGKLMIEEKLIPDMSPSIEMLRHAIRFNQLCSVKALCTDKIISEHRGKLISVLNENSSDELIEYVFKIENVFSDDFQEIIDLDLATQPNDFPDSRVVARSPLNLLRGAYRTSKLDVVKKAEEILGAEMISAFGWKRILPLTTNLSLIVRALSQENNNLSEEILEHFEWALNQSEDILPTICALSFFHQEYEMIPLLSQHCTNVSISWIDVALQLVKYFRKGTHQKEKIVESFQKLDELIQEGVEIPISSRRQLLYSVIKFDVVELLKIINRRFLSEDINAVLVAAIKGYRFRIVQYLLENCLEKINFYQVLMDLVETNNLFYLQWLNDSINHLKKKHSKFIT